jgi:long-chain acyl-CoA synthetase
VRKGDKVVLYITNSAQWVIAFFGIQKIGAVVVPVAPIYTSFEIEYMINDSGAETIICLDTNFGYVQDIFSKTSLKRVIVTNLVDLLPLWKRTVGFLFDKIPNGIVKKGENVYFFKDLIKQSPEKLDVEIDPWKDLSYILYTGGTTGFPKGVPGNHMGMTSYVRDVMVDVAGGYIEEGKTLILRSTRFSTSWLLGCLSPLA